MHVLEPAPKRISKRSRRSIKTFWLVAVLVVGMAVGAFIVRNKQSTGLLGLNQQASNTSSVATNNPSKYLNGFDFRKLYEQTALPNTQQLPEPPSITGNAQADSRIRQIAESRGYKLQPLPVQSIVRLPDTFVDDNLLQPNAHEGWLKLKNLAEKDNVHLEFKAGYRSIDKQRQLFMAQLQVSPAQIAAGQADSQVIAVLQKVIPPGYSRHHTGYAIDIACKDEVSKAFALTKCYKWLSNNNYHQAKQAGFIPSTSEGVGPPATDPNIAEYVWVGIDNY